MLKSLLLFSGIVAITFLEFVYYPGHSYLAGESQPLVAMMERLNAHGFLSRDLAAINPNLTYTIYDEVTLFLTRASGHSLEWALAAQQFVFRFAGVTGVLLLALAAGLEALPALVVAGLVNAGVQLPGLHLALIDREPTPFAFALGLTVLAFGLLAKSKPLLAGLSGGLALVYQPVLAAVFWLSVLAAFALHRPLRPLLRPTLPAFLVFALLLANAAQLQPGRGEAQPLFEGISNSWMQLQLQRTPDVWVSAWSPWALLFYAALATGGFFALRRLWPHLTMPSRWVFLLPLMLGVISMPTAMAGVQLLRWACIGEIQPARTLALSVIVALVAFAAAGSQAWQRKERWIAGLWLIPLVIVPFLLRLTLPSLAQQREFQSAASVAQWAERNTWGGSLFLFPDVGESAIPGAFRGRAIRAVYVDWTSGTLVKTFPAFGAEWARRWQETGRSSYSPSRLQSLLNLPIEYVVLHRRNALRNITPELSTPDFVVYDTHLLQTAAHPLRSSSGY